MIEPQPDRQKFGILGLILIGFLFLVGGVVAYLGIGDSLLPVEDAPTMVSSVSLPLPQEEPEIPAGPFRDQFVTNCVVCHSPRLIFNQPEFSSEQWTTTVRKMVASYGAVIPPSQEKEIVSYLVAMQHSAWESP
jgi:hypothetical protein